MSKLIGWNLGRTTALLLAVALAACASQPGRLPRGASVAGAYPPPGPPEDPWGPYVVEASRRFRVPERWIRQVMRQESGGQSNAVSSAGAMGLMQVMPATYEILRRRYHLGDDPFDPHNNMLAGTAYLKEMYDRYGSPGFLAAYNAGPGRLESYLANGTPLPDETVNYVASIAPRLGTELPVSGPLAVYAAAGSVTGVATGAMPVVVAANGCDPDAAYDPDRVCPAPAPAAAPGVAAVAPVASAPPAASAGGCDPDAAYDPTQPCHAPALPPDTTPAPRLAVAIAALPATPAPPAPMFVTPPKPAPAPVFVAPPTPSAVPPRLQLAAAWPIGGAWSIQVGAFADSGTARAAATRARTAAPDLLAAAQPNFPPTTPFGGNVLYRARLGALSSVQAAQSCARLTAQQLACMVVPPGRGS